MKLLSLLVALMLLAFSQGCASVDEDEIETVQQGSTVAALPECVVVEKDSRPLPNVCEGKLTIVDAEWTDGELADILAAMNNWNAMLGQEYFQLTSVDAAQESCHISQGEREGNVLATWKKEQNMVVDTVEIRASKKYTAQFQTLMQHELGHSVGLRHRENGVMCSAVWTTSEFNQTDREQCQALGLCK